MRAHYSRLSHKITRAMLIAGAVTICVILIVALAILDPLFEKEAVSNANANVKLIVHQAEAKIELIKAYAANIADSYELQALMRNYNRSFDKTEIQESIRKALDRKKDEMSSVQRIALQMADGEILSTTKELTENELRLFETEEYRYFSGLDYAKSFFYVYKAPFASDYAWGNEPEEIYVATYCMNFYLDNERYTITLFVEIGDIVEATQSLMTQMDSYAWIDSTDAPFLSCGQEQVLPMANEELQDRLWFNFDILEKPHGYLFMHTLKESRWVFAAYISDFTLLRTYGGTMLLAVGTFIVLVLSVILLLIPLINRFTDPVRKLTNQMRQVASGNLAVRSEIQTNDEIEELANGFNYMLGELNGHIDKLIEKEKIQQRMKYSLLIREIDPHFIYNTMNSINYLARKGRNREIIEINSALIHILQDRLRISSIEVFDTVKQEIDMVKQYMIIQQFRFNNDVELICDIAEEIQNEQIPKNILQPLVENALLHGLLDEDGEPIKGCIEITAQKKDGSLVLTVKDSGRGMPQDKIEELNGRKATENDRGRHIGIQNIKERLTYLYGTEECLYIENSSGGGVCVTLTLRKNDKA